MHGAHTPIVTPVALTNGSLSHWRGGPSPLLLPAHHLVTHGVIVGTTGSGKTGLLTVLVEETLRARVPVIMIDVKGDLPDLLLAFPSFDAAAFLPWVEGGMDPCEERRPQEIAEAIAAHRRASLAVWGGRRSCRAGPHSS